jgi:hypothetical protein
MARSAGEEGLNHQVVSFKSPADTPKCPECCGNHGFCAAVPVVRIHLPPAESQQRWLIVSSAIAQESSTAIAIRSRSADRGGRVAPPAADPSQATGRVKGRINQLHRARVLEVRIQSPPAESQQTFGSSSKFFTNRSGRNVWRGGSLRAEEICPELGSPRPGHAFGDSGIPQEYIRRLIRNWDIDTPDDRDIGP